MNPKNPFFFSFSFLFLSLSFSLFPFFLIHAGYPYLARAIDFACSLQWLARRLERSCLWQPAISSDRGRLGLYGTIVRSDHGSAPDSEYGCAEESVSNSRASI